MKQLRENIPEFAKEWAEECIKLMNVKKVIPNKMKKIIMSIKRFIWSLFNKDKRTHVLTYEELVKALNEGKKKIVLDKDISCAAPLQIDSKVTIDGDGHRIYCERERIGFSFGLYEDTILSTLHLAKSRVEHEDGTEVKLSEKGAGVFRVATHLSQCEVEKYQFINFSCGWTAYTWPIVRYDNGYIYFRSYGTDYCVDFDWYQGNSKKYTQYRLVYCSERQYSNYLLSLNLRARVEMKNLNLRGGIFVSEGTNLRLDNCVVMCCTECGIKAKDKSNVVVTGCFFGRTWKSTIKSKGSIYVRDTNFANVNQGRQNTGAIDCEGDATIVDNVLFSYGSLGIRVGKVKAMTKDECPSVQVISNTLVVPPVNNQQGVVTDTGAIYLAANSAFATIKGNTIQNYKGRGNNHAIYCDDGAYNFEVSGNRIYNCPNGYAISSRCADPSKTLRGYAGGIPNTNRLIKDNYCESGIWFEGNADVEDNKCIFQGNIIHEFTYFKTKLQNVK